MKLFKTAVALFAASLTFASCSWAAGSSKNWLEARLAGERLVLSPKKAPVVAANYMPGGIFNDQYRFLGATSGPLGVTNTTQHTYAFWLNMSRQTGALPNVNNGGLTTSQPLGHCEATAGNSPGICLSIDNSGYGAQWNFDDSTGTIGGSYKFVAPGYAAMDALSGSWHHYITTFDTVSGAWAVYIDGVSAGWTNPAYNAGVLPDFNNGNGWRFLNGSYPAINVSAWVAEIYEANFSIVCISAGHGPGGVSWPDCTGANTIRPLYLNRMISGSGSSAKPVNMGADCSRVTGTAPQICLTGTGSAMATNTGTATNPISTQQMTAVAYTSGAFTTASTSIGMTTTNTLGVGAGWVMYDYTINKVLGTVAAWTSYTITLQGSGFPAYGGGNGDNIYFYGPATASGPAPYGPGGMNPHQATLKWQAWTAFTPAASANITPGNNANGIASGDLLLLLVGYLNGSTAPPTPGCPSGWSTAGSAASGTGSLHANTYIVACWLIASSPTAAGSALSVPTITTAGATTQAIFYMADYGATAGISGVDVSGCQMVAAGTTANTPALTTTHANDTLVSIAANYTWDSFSIAGGATQWIYASRPATVVADEVLTAIGSTQRTWTINPANYENLTCAVAITPN